MNCDTFFSKCHDFRVMVFGHRQALLEQLNTSQDPAQVLHIASLVLCQGVTQNMLHASGRYVNILLAFLQPHLPAATYATLQEYYGELGNI